MAKYFVHQFRTSILFLADINFVNFFACLLRRKFMHPVIPVETRKYVRKRAERKVWKSKDEGIRWFQWGKHFLKRSLCIEINKWINIVGKVFACFGDAKATYAIAAKSSYSFHVLLWYNIAKCDRKYCLVPKHADTHKLWWMSLWHEYWLRNSFRIYRSEQASKSYRI